MVWWKPFIAGAGAAALYRVNASQRNKLPGKLPGLEGPFRYPNGRVLYWDPREGKYYDRSTDMYVEDEEIAFIHGLKKGRRVSGSTWDRVRSKRRPSRIREVDSYDEVVRTVDGPLTFEYRGEENLYFRDRHNRLHMFKYDGRKREEAKIAKLFQDAFADPSVEAEFTLAGANRGRKASSDEEILRTSFGPDSRGGSKLFLTYDKKDGQYVVRSRFQDFYRSRKGLKPNSAKARAALKRATDKFETRLLFYQGGTEAVTRRDIPEGHRGVSSRHWFVSMPHPQHQDIRYRWDGWAANEADARKQARTAFRVTRLSRGTKVWAI